MSTTVGAELRTHPPRGAGSLRALFDPRGVAVIGASSDPSKLGGAMAQSLASFDGPIALVNSRGGSGTHATIAEAAAHGSVPIDLAVLCVPAAACPAVIAECGDAGVSAALVCAGGFGESGPAGQLVQDDLVQAARRAQVRLLGPNTSGFVVPATGLTASFVPGVRTLEPGSIAVVAASGGLHHALAFALERSGHGLSIGVGIGAGIDVNAPDVLDHLTLDDRTEVIVLHLEAVTDGPALLAAVRRATASTPVVALVVGKNDVAEFAQSHTGALATSWRTTRALLQQAGAIVVDDEQQLITAGIALRRTRIPPRRSAGVGLVTAQAGPGLLIADQLHSHRVSLPRLTENTQRALGEMLPPITFQANPVDTGRPGPHHRRVLEAVAKDPGVDLVAVYGLTEPVVDLPDVVARADLGSTAVIIGLDGPGVDVAERQRQADDLGVTCVIGAGNLVTAIHAVTTRARVRVEQDNDSAVGLTVGGAQNRFALPPATHPLTESQAKDFLDTVGITTPTRRVCRSDEEAHRALAELGGPVAVKLSDASVLHKSDIGGVHLGVADARSLQTALSALAAVGATEFLVEQMAPSGIDLVVAGRRDPVFGPVVVVGVGGIATEVYADVAIAAVPTSRERLRRLPEQLTGSALLNGFRGAPAADPDQLADVLAALAGLICSNPALDEVEINPLRVHADGLMALDAVITRGPRTGAGQRRAKELG